jgi:hypothetical protein
MFVLQDSMSAHFMGLPPHECDVCWDAGFQGGACDMEICGRRIREQLEASLFRWNIMPPGITRRSLEEGLRAREVAVLRFGAEFGEPFYLGVFAS